MVQIDARSAVLDTGLIFALPSAGLDSRGNIDNKVDEEFLIGRFNRETISSLTSDGRGMSEWATASKKFLFTSSRAT